MNLVNIQGLRQTGMDDAKMTPSAWHTMGTVCGREAAMSVPAEGTRINSFKDGCISCICFNATATEECWCLPPFSENCIYWGHYLNVCGAIVPGLSKDRYKTYLPIFKKCKIFEDEILQSQILQTREESLGRLPTSLSNMWRTRLLASLNNNTKPPWHTYRKGYYARIWRDYEVFYKLYVGYICCFAEGCGVTEPI